MVLESARAKINLYLDVTGKRADGYHDIMSVMQSVSLADTICLETAGGISLTCDDPSLPTDQHNLAVRAADAFFSFTGVSGGVSIGITKRIPVASGLAGGSTDAAAVLRGLNRLYGANLLPDQLCQIGAKIGADVPFCVMGGTMLTEGIGERMTPLPSMPDCYLVIARSGPGISTPMAYAALDRKFDNFSARSDRTVAPLISALQMQNIDTVCQNLYNIFETVVPPENQMTFANLETMKQSGAIAALMSGSGPSVFGVFREKDSADLAANQIQRSGGFAAVCRPEAIG